MAHTTKLIEQLRALLLLTQTEAQIARVRVGQARTDAVRRELAQNAENAERRTEEIVAALRDLGGVPDVLTPAVGRVAAVVKAVLDNLEPLPEALLQDLTLEHQLVDRARYVKVLAKTAEQPKVVKLADRLLTAHTATVDWLTTVLAEEALGGPAALRSTGLQKVAGTATRVVNLPSRAAVEQVNRTVDTLGQSTENARARISAVTGKAVQLSGGLREVLTAGRDASLSRAERVARRNGDRSTAEAIHHTRAETGSLTPAELPIKDYDNLSTTDAVTAVKKLTDPEQLRTVVRYEEANKKRSGLVSAAQTRLAALAKDAAGVS